MTRLFENAREHVHMKYLRRIARLIAGAFLILAVAMALVVPLVSAAEQQLADKHVPIAYLRAQPTECSAVGERYVPIPVDITLNNPKVKLRRHKRDGERSDPVVKVGPSAQDLVNTDATYYIDLPGDSLEPGCGYEKWSRERAAKLGLAPAVYAHIATEPDRPGKLA